MYRDDNDDWEEVPQPKNEDITLVDDSDDSATSAPSKKAMVKTTITTSPDLNASHYEATQK